MDNTTRFSLVKRYLSLTDSTIHTELADELAVTFSEGADRVLARRPFYWAFIDRTGTPAQPMSVVLHTSPSPATMGFVPLTMAYPSPLLTAMVNDINEKGKIVQCFEVLPTGSLPQYETWLNSLVVIRCYGSSTIRMTHTVGISLWNGDVQTDFLTWLGDRNVQSHYPMTFHAPSNVSFEQARGILQTFVGEQLSRLNLTWAVEAYANYERECALAADFGDRVAECEAQLHPRIEVEVRGAGLFHLLRRADHQ
jgi:hypothetical protein